VTLKIFWKKCASDHLAGGGNEGMKAYERHSGKRETLKILGANNSSLPKKRQSIWGRVCWRHKAKNIGQRLNMDRNRRKALGTGRPVRRWDDEGLAGCYIYEKVNSLLLT